MPFVPIARLEDVPKDRGLRVELNGVAIGLYRVGDVIHAMEDTCPHAGYPLAEGDFADCVITCRAHGWPFDVTTGFDPKHADGFPIPCFAVEIHGQEIHIDLENQINDPRKHRKQR